MRSIVVAAFVTLDGIMQAPGGPDEDPAGNFKYGGWTAPYFAAAGDAAGEMMARQMKPADLLLGRKTYDIFAGYWPHHADMWPGINDVAKYVVSGRPRELAWKNSRLITGDVFAGIRALKAGEGTMLQVYGSGRLVQTLLQQLFGDGTAAAAFRLTESLITPNGVIFANYRRAGEVTTGTVGG